MAAAAGAGWLRRCVVERKKREEMLHRASHLGEKEGALAVCLRGLSVPRKRKKKGREIRGNKHNVKKTVSY